MSIDIAQILLDSLGAVADTVGIRDATLVRSTSGARTPGAESAGTNPTTTPYPCKALIEIATIANVPATLVQQDDRKIGVLGASLPDGIVPKVQDRITLIDIDGVSKTFRLVAPVSGDGSGSRPAYIGFVARK